MKKIILSSIISLSALTIFAGGVENKTNMSAGYLRNPSRNTENERPEAAFYNIAGTGFLKNGLYIEAGNQFVFKEYANELKTGDKFANQEKYSVPDYYSNDETNVFFYPNFDVVYKKNRWSMFLTFGVYAGGGALSYSEGTSATSLMFLNGASQQGEEATKSYLAYSAAKSEWDKAVTNNFRGSTEAAEAYVKSDAGKNSELAKLYNNMNLYNSSFSNNSQAANASLKMAQNHSLDVTSLTLGGQIGAAYLVTDWLSLSAAYRYTYGTQEMILKCNDQAFNKINGGNKISYEAKGFGQSCVFGIHAKPPVIPGLDLSVQYQSLSRIEYNVDNVKGDIAKYYGITDDSNFRTDLPAVLNIGTGYRIFEPLYISTSFNYYFNDFASQDNILGETDYENSWEIAFGMDYKICSFLGASAGIAYSNQGITDTSNSTFNPVLDSLTVGGGVEVSAIKNLTITTSAVYVKYFDADYYLSGNKTELSKNLWMLSLGVTYKPF